MYTVYTHWTAPLGQGIGEGLPSHECSVTDYIELNFLNDGEPDGEPEVQTRTGVECFFTAKLYWICLKLDMTYLFGKFLRILKALEFTRTSFMALTI